MTITPSPEDPPPIPPPMDDRRLVRLVRGELPPGLLPSATILEGDFIVLVPLELRGEPRDEALLILKATDEVTLVNLNSPTLLEDHKLLTPADLQLLQSARREGFQAPPLFAERDSLVDVDDLSWEARP